VKTYQLVWCICSTCTVLSVLSSYGYNVVNYWLTLIGNLNIYPDGIRGARLYPCITDTNYYTLQLASTRLQDNPFLNQYL
jgi:hypothetical protein